MVHNSLPVKDLSFALPFGVLELKDTEVEKLQDGLVIGKRALTGYLSETGIDAFYGIGSLHDSPYIRAVVKQLFHVLEVVFPDRYSPRIGCPFSLELFKQSANFCYRGMKMF